MGIPGMVGSHMEGLGENALDIHRCGIMGDGLSGPTSGA